jgi:hypothetical protein
MMGRPTSNRIFHFHWARERSLHVRVVLACVYLVHTKVDDITLATSNVDDGHHTHRNVDDGACSPRSKHQFIF